MNHSKKKKLRSKSSHLYRELVFGNKIWDGAAALAFYVIMAVFPGIFALVAFSSLLGSQFLAETISQWWISFLPTGAQDLVARVVADISGNSNAIPFFSIGVVVSLWSATTGVVAVIRQINRIYDVEDNRSMLKLRGVAMVITLVLLVTMVFSLLLIVGGKFILQMLARGYYIGFDILPLAQIARYVFAIFVFFLGFVAIYYFGPIVRVQLKTLWKGSLFASLLFTFSSFVYSQYLLAFGGLSTTYGGLGAVIGLLMWLYLLSFSMLVGAKINSLERG